MRIGRWLVLLLWAQWWMVWQARMSCGLQGCMFRLLLRVIKRCPDSAAGRSPACSAFIYALQVEGFELELQQVQVNVSR
jgi:hypothetical protein